MRDINRIKPLLEELSSFWMRHPDLRLGQIVVIAASLYNQTRDYPRPDNGINIFYIEDDEFLTGLQAVERGIDGAKNKNTNESNESEQG